MWRILVQPPAAEPVTLEEAKAHLRVEGTEEDALIAGLIRAARESCERMQGRAYLRQRWQSTIEGGAPPARLPLRPLPVLDAVSVEWRDDGGTWQALPATAWRLDAAREAIELVELVPAGATAWRATHEAGFGDDPGDVPQRIKQAILLLVGHWFEQREAAGARLEEIPFGVRALLALDRAAWV